jgi:predicted nucleic acid-binding protein
MIVVSDTSPINYLTLIGHEALLQSLFGEIIIPASVFDELSHPGAPVQIKHLLSVHPAWLRIVEPTPDPGSGLGHLDCGERDAILLGIEMRADFVLMDEARGREAGGPSAWIDRYRHHRSARASDSQGPGGWY